MLAKLPITHPLTRAPALRGSLAPHRQPLRISPLRCAQSSKGAATSSAFDRSTPRKALSTSRCSRPAQTRAASQATEAEIMDVDDEFVDLRIPITVCAMSSDTVSGWDRVSKTLVWRAGHNRISRLWQNNITQPHPNKKSWQADCSDRERGKSKSWLHACSYSRCLLQALHRKWHSCGLLLWRLAWNLACKYWTSYLSCTVYKILEVVCFDNHGVVQFGEIDIDSQLVVSKDTLPDSGDQIMMLNNGCMCCSVKEDLLRMLSELVIFSQPCYKCIQ